jgi:hypothetical protein
MLENFIHHMKHDSFTIESIEEAFEQLDDLLYDIADTKQLMKDRKSNALAKELGNLEDLYARFMKACEGWLHHHPEQVPYTIDLLEKTLNP